MLAMAGGIALGAFELTAQAQAPMYKTPLPAGLMIERWKQTGNDNSYAGLRSG